MKKNTHSHYQILTYLWQVISDYRIHVGWITCVPALLLYILYICLFQTRGAYKKNKLNYK